MPQKYTNLGSLFADIADAIREKKGTNESIVADDFPDEISSIEDGSGIINFEKKFIKRTIQLSIYENSYVTNIGNGGFYYCSSLTSVNFPQAIDIGNLAFQSCFLLTSANFPLATNIGNAAFQSCFSLTSVSFPKTTNIGSAAFRYCSSLTSVNFPLVTTIGSQAFRYCSNLTSVILGGQQSQSGIIYSGAFSNCYHLTDLYLQGSYLYSLSNSNVFNSTPIAGYSTSAGKFGSIYVPASLYSQYISATNWTYFSSRFVSVSQSSGGDENPEPEIPSHT